MTVRTNGAAKVVFVGRAPEPEIRKLTESAPPGFSLSVVRPETSVPEMIGAIESADFLLCEAKVGIKEEVYRAARNVKLLQTWGMGYDAFPLGLLKELGIPLANAGGANATTVAEHAVMLMLMLVRQTMPSILAAREGKLRQNLDGSRFTQLYGKTVGLVGFGHIGRWTGRIVAGFGANVIFHDVETVPHVSAALVPARQVPFEELLRVSDIVSLHVPLTPETEAMIGRRELEAMKPHAVLINTCRGEVVDEAALIAALRDKVIAGAGLDVFEREPVDPANPLLDMENVVCTPHTGGFAYDNVPQRLAHIWGNFEAVLAGKRPASLVG